MPALSDREELVRLATIMEALVNEVRILSGRVEELKDDRVVMVEHQLTRLESRAVNAEERLAKIEDNGRWMFRTIVGEGIALVVGITLWAISNL